MLDYPNTIKVGKNSMKVNYKKVKGLSSSVRINKAQVQVSLSKFLIGKRRDKTIEKFLKWAEKRLSKVSDNTVLTPVYKDAGKIITHNKVYELNVFYYNKDRCRSILKDGGVIELFLPVDAKNHKLQELVEKIIIKDQTEYLKNVVDELNQLYFQEKYGHVRFKRISSRFGSCSSKRNINIAFRLLFAPKEVFRYVCLHELAHLKEFNHSKRFWQIVEDAMPEYKECEKWLRENGFLLG